MLDVQNSLDAAGVLNKGDVEIITHKVAYSGFFRIDHYNLRHRRFDGEWSQARHLELFERGHGVAVLPYDPHTEQLVLIEQFRVGAIDSDTPWLIETVAGAVEEGESHEDVARRESMEEAHCRVTDLVPICQVYVSPGGSSETTRLFCGKVDLAAFDKVFAGLDDEGEDIRVHVVSFDQAMQALNEGRVHSAQAVICLQWLQLNKQALLEKWL